MDDLARVQESAQERVHPSFRGTKRFALTVLLGPNPGLVVKLDKPEVTIGRGKKADVVVDDPGLSRIHARIHVAGDRVIVEDLKSTNGTYIGGQRIAGPTQAQDGERVQFGGNVLTKLSLQDDMETATSQRLFFSASRDGLTRLFNRRYFDERMEDEFAFAHRHGANLSLLLVDIDKFKPINDQLGHQAGDAVLKEMAATLKHAVRAEDTLARYGGEEFVIIARGIDYKGARAFGERVRTTVERVMLPWDNRVIRISCSVGVATMVDRDFDTSAELIRSTDQALYHAKETGRNRVVCFEEMTPQQAEAM